MKRMRIPEVVMHGSKRVLTNRQLAEMFEVEQKIVSRNYQRNSERFEEGKHYFLLTGEELKRFKKVHQQIETLKFVSILYLWTQEGAMLLAKMCCSDSAWQALDSLLGEVYSEYETDAERLGNMSPIGVDRDGNLLVKHEDWFWLQEQAELLRGNDGMSVKEIRAQYIDLHRHSLSIEKENERLRAAIKQSLEKHKWNNEESARILEQALGVLE